MIDYFVENHDPAWWDGELKMSTIAGVPDWRYLTRSVPCGNGLIPIEYNFNGASVGLLRHIPFFGFPKWKHPIATCRHDWRCDIAEQYKISNPPEYRRLRKIADEMFREDVGKGGTKWEQRKGYVGVRIGAML